VHDAPPEGPSYMALSGVFDGLDDRQQGQDAPTSLDTAPWPYSPGASDGGASTSPSASDAENAALPTHSPPGPNRGF